MADSSLSLHVWFVFLTVFCGLMFFHILQRQPGTAVWIFDFWFLLLISEVLLIEAEFELELQRIRLLMNQGK